MDRIVFNVISHSHWDREWYLPFQQFRARLVRMMDRLLATMRHDPAYRYFMLDGQTVVLEDYLAVRPERRAEIAGLVAEGRLLVGPWYVQPDEFLVSGEALIRNLLRGQRVAHEFGSAMPVGYIPDPFGQISQMPQILRGFGLDSAVFWRGASDDITSTEFLWQAPDGSEVLTIYMPFGYCNGQPLSFDLAAARRQVAAMREQLVPLANTPYALLMNGNDHVEPSPNLPANIAALNEELAAEGIELQHTTLPQHIVQVRTALGERELLTHRGEFRSSRRSHILPGVLSARIWIKQANARIQTLLERAAEPLAVWQLAASHASPPPADDLDAATYPQEVADRLSRQQARLRLAWQYLLQNHAHDSICGCGVDAVHDEMRGRFTAAEGVGNELVEEGLQALAAQVNTAALGEDGVAVVVYNNAPARREYVDVAVQVPGRASDFVLTDASGDAVDFQLAYAGSTAEPILRLAATPEQALATLTMTADGKVANMMISNVQLHPHPTEAAAYLVEIEASEVGVPNLTTVQHSARLIERLTATGDAQKFYIEAHQPRLRRFRFMAALPTFGYSSYRLRPLASAPVSVEVQAVAEIAPDQPPAPATLLPPVEAAPEVSPQPIYTEARNWIANEFFRVEADRQTGWLTVRDAQTGVVLAENICLLDQGDAGDEYNYSPPAEDTAVVMPRPGSVSVSQPVNRHGIMVEYELELPKYLSDDRQRRDPELWPCGVSFIVSVRPGVPRVDFEVTLLDNAHDHRLRVLFGLPFGASESRAESAFDVVSRPLGVPDFDETWLEQPQPSHPQQSFVAVEGQGRGLVLANRGLPEYEVSSDGQSSVLLLTLLRSVGWLSRSDLTTRRGHAGPGLETPGAQVLGEHTFEFSLIPFEGDLIGSRAYEHAHNFITPPVATVTTLHPGPLPVTASLLEIEPPELVVSTIKPAEDGSGWLLRCWNISDQPVSGRIRCHLPYATAGRSNLAETDFATLQPDADGWLTVAVRGKEIVTLLFKP